MSVYLDNSATQYIAGEKDNEWFNPNAKYAHEASKLLQGNYKKMKELLGVSSGMVVFGGQNASQLIDLLFAKCKINDIDWTCSKYEHDCVYNKAYTKFNSDEELFDWIGEVVTKTGYKEVVCRMLVNNITGEIFDNKPLGQYCRKHNQFFLMDCTSAIGHVELPNDLEKWCDCVVMSGHKFGGGYMGCMWLSDRLCNVLNIKTQSDLASGTPNAKGIDEFVSAFELANKDIDNKNIEWENLGLHLQDKFIENNIKYEDVLNGGIGTYAINAVRLPGINADALQQYLASKNIYIGRGASSCDSNNDDFRVLQAYGLTKKEASEVIRVSFSEWNTVDDVDELVREIKKFKEKFVL